MNNQRLRNHPLAGLSFSLLLLVGVVSPVNADTEYGPIRSGESLSGIVNKNYIISPYDDAVIMQEILRLNPRAFINNNMSLIRTGVTLTLPSDATIRRSRGSNDSAVVSRAVPRPQVTSVVSDERLSQIRNERDQANLRLRRIESTTAAQIETLKSQVSSLEADKVKLNQQLSESAASVPQASNSEPTTSELEEKEQKIADLDSQIAGLIQSSKDLKRTHQITLGELEKSNKALQDQLASQEQDVVASTDKQIAELQAQNQQKMAALLKSFDGNELALKDALVEKSQLQRQFEVEVGALKRDIADGEASIAKLSTEKSALSAELSEANLTIKNLATEEASNQGAVTSTTVSEAVAPENAASSAGSEALLSGPVTKQMLVKRLESPVAFPLWGLLLGAFALGFTTLMMLFTRSRKQIVQSVAPDANIPAAEGSNLSAQEEALVFRASDPSIQDPDIETLRAPQKRDPSRVAILDPSMTAAAVTTAGLASAAAIAGQPNEVEEVAVTSKVRSESQVVEEKFKLLIAEAYEDLGDSAAANQMLLEVQNQK